MTCHVRVRKSVCRDGIDAVRKGHVKAAVGKGFAANGGHALGNRHAGYSAVLERVRADGGYRNAVQFLRNHNGAFVAHVARDVHGRFRIAEYLKAEQRGCQGDTLAVHDLAVIACDSAAELPPVQTLSHSKGQRGCAAVSGAVCAPCSSVIRVLPEIGHNAYRRDTHDSGITHCQQLTG